MDFLTNLFNAMTVSLVIHRDVISVRNILVNTWMIAKDLIQPVSSKKFCHEMNNCAEVGTKFPPGEWLTLA